VSPGDLVNRGFILHRPLSEPGRTFIVTGLQRSGTSLIAAMLQHAGLFIGSEINPAVYEDEEIARVLATREQDGLRQVVQHRNALHARWGFKCPLLNEVFDPSQLELFDRPRLIVAFRDPVAIAVRTSLSEYRPAFLALQDAITRQAALADFLGQVECPCLMVSYEKTLVFPADTVDAVLGFCDIAPDEPLRERLLALIEPNRPDYIATARRRYEGLIEGVRDGQLYGWCWLTKAAAPVMLDVLVDQRFVMRVTADVFRQDLLDAGIGHGRHGFFVPVETLHARPDSTIRVWVAEHGIELNNSGKRLCDFGPSA
jgi:hypothetical protein